MKSNRKSMVRIISVLLLGIVGAFMVFYYHGSFISDSKMNELSEVQSDSESSVSFNIKLDENNGDMPSNSYDSYKSSDSEKSEDKEREYGSISDYFKECDPYWNKSDHYQTAIKAYEDWISCADTEDLIADEFNNKPGFQYAYIDEDDIPELLVCKGSFHTSGIIVCRYISEKNKVVLIGEFSSYGWLNYVDRGNRIDSQYGSQGLYMHMISRIEGDKAILVGSVAEDGTGRHSVYLDEGEVWVINDGMYYYAGYPMPDRADGSHKDSYSGLHKGTDLNAVMIDFPSDDYVVSEEEYKKEYYNLLATSDETQLIRVHYDDMSKISFCE